jgi:hypothetical protein
MKNIQFAFRHTKIGNTRKVTVIPMSKALYIPLHSKKDCPRLKIWLSIHTSPSISNYTISDFQEIWYRSSLRKVAGVTFLRICAVKQTRFTYGHKWCFALYLLHLSSHLVSWRGNIHKNSLKKCEFHDNESSESRILLLSHLNEFAPVPSLFFSDWDIIHHTGSEHNVLHSLWVH